MVNDHEERAAGLEKTGTHASPLARWMLRGRKTRHWVRTIYAWQSIFKLRNAMRQGMTHKDYYQAGKSVDGIHKIEPAGKIVSEFTCESPD